MNPLETEAMARLIRTDKDFIALKRYEYSLTRLLTKYPEACPDHVIAGALKIDEKEVQVEYERIVAKLRGLMGVEV